jgi:SET domain-containing protein
LEAITADVQIKHNRFGKGVYATRSFPQGALVLEVHGPLVRQRSIYTIQIARDLHLLPRPPAKYLNHSCDPNLGVKTNSKGLPDFYALRDIETGEHLTYDYAMTEVVLEEMEMGRPRVPCGCGTANCRGFLGSYRELPAEVKQRYSGFISDYLREEPME